MEPKSNMEMLESSSADNPLRGLSKDDLGLSFRKPPGQGSCYALSQTTNLVGGRFVEPLRGVTNHRFSGDNGLQSPDKFGGFVGVPEEPNLESQRDSLAKPSTKEKKK